MDQLIEISQAKLAGITTQPKRFLYTKINWNWRLNGIVGARGTGKTMLLLQRLKEQGNQTKSIYISMDEFFFTDNRLYSTIVELRKRGFGHFYLDEIHKYEGWSRELKNLYDTYQDIQITFTGSSILDILKQEVDLSRRAVIYHLPELSFREYLLLTGQPTIDAIPLPALLQSHTDVRNRFPADFRPLVHFKTYLESGMYPFFLEQTELFHHRLLQVVKLIIESDLKFIEGYDARNAQKIFHLLYSVAQNVPFKPNVSKLSDKIGITRNTLIHYFHYLDKAHIVHLLYAQGKSTSALQKPEKLLLRNPNLAYTISPKAINAGSLRESYFVSQVGYDHQVSLHNTADFVVDDQFVFEIGGSNKSAKQLQNLPNGYLIKDEIEYGYERTIPLWMFGLLY